MLKALHRRRPPRGARIQTALATLTLGFAALVTVPSRAETPSVKEQPLVALGRSLFFDANLSEPRGTSCASCHDPSRAFASENGSTRGVPRGSRPAHFARRATPSLLYLKYVPSFRFFQEGDDPGLSPMGGFFWDGRADSIRELARQPLLNPDEMNNRDGASIAVVVRQSAYAALFTQMFGAAPLTGDATLAAVGRALEAYLTTDEMAPFSSRFDDFVRGTGRLSTLELEGLELFKDPAKGGCAGCHQLDDSSHDPTRSLFTDYGFDAVGVPRNAKLDARPPDRGLCERTDRVTPSDDATYCMSFRTPSLRNVAVRSAFMHNGAFTRLETVVAFYATRDTSPRRWYPSGVRFDSVPREFRGQINVTAPPYDRHAGEPPALNEREIGAVVAFLRALTDAKYEHR